MASKVVVKRKTATKRNRSTSKGTARDSMGRYSSEGSVDEHTKQELMKMIERM